MSLGASYRASDTITFSAAWVHGFRNSITGGVREEPVATATIDSQIDSIVLGVNVQFGPGRKARTEAPAPADAPADGG
ncbi:MAG TPA: hypothetical protein VG406_02245 [Isosphaeraceae bacterium]|jgi:hypothetical protein|nr:hypothetical protein [Isosphaeraceae bacterium]